jgi:transcriptional regulator
MYLPDEFRLDDRDRILDAIAANPFAALATNGPEGPELTHLPLILRQEAGETVLYGHFARANPHWKALNGTTPAVAAFRGPHGYISPSWYATKQETGKVVPTWNYVIVHARGIPERLEPGTDSRGAIDMLTDTMEQPRAEPWRTDDAPERYMEVMMRGIVAFRMVVTDLSAKAKLSQNKTEADITGAASGLEATGQGELAGLMRAAMGE